MQNHSLLFFVLAGLVRQSASLGLAPDALTHDEDMDDEGRKREFGLEHLMSQITPSKDASAHDRLVSIEKLVEARLGPDKAEPADDVMTWWCNQTKHATTQACLMRRIQRANERIEEGKANAAQQQAALAKAKSEAIAEKKIEPALVKAIEKEEEEEADEDEDLRKSQETRIEALERRIVELTNAREAAAARAAARAKSMVREEKEEAVHDWENEQTKRIAVWFCNDTKNKAHLLCKKAALAAAKSDMVELAPQLEATDRLRLITQFRNLEKQFNLTDASVSALSQQMYTAACAQPQFRSLSICKQHAKRLSYSRTTGRVREWYCAKPEHSKAATCMRLALANAEEELAAAGVPFSHAELAKRLKAITAGRTAEDEESEHEEIIGEWCEQPAQATSTFCVAWAERMDKEL